MTRDVALYLEDIVENLDDAVAFTRGMAYRDFKHDKKTANAVVRSIEVIGEAVKHVPDEIRDLDREIPWRNMVGMRDRCIHNYFGVDCEMIWNVVHNDMPRIRPRVQSLLDTIRRNSP